MRSRKLLAVAGAITALSLGVAACGDDDDGDSTSGGGSSETLDLTVGALVPQTGDLSIFAPAGEKAAKLAVEDLNSALKDAGSDSKVNLVVGDTETKPQAARQAAESLISDGATCLAGAWASSNTIPVGQSVASVSGVPLISPASTSAEITDLPDDGFVFRVAPSDNLQAKLLAEKVGEDLGTDATVSVAGRNDAYGEGFINVFVEEFEANGGTVNGPTLYDVEATSYDSEASEIVSGNPDGFVIIDFPDPYGKVGQALVRTGDFDPSKLYIADGLASDTTPEGVSDDAIADSTGTRPASPEDTEPATAFDKEFAASDLKPAERGTFDGQNYDAVVLCGLAAIAAGSTDGAAIKDQLPNVAGPGGDQYDLTQLNEAVQALLDGDEIDYTGVTGPIDFDDNGDPTSATYETFTYKNGKLEVTGQVEASAEE